MSIVLVGSSSGSITLQEPAVAGTTVLNLPAVSGTVLTTGSTFAGTGPAFSAYNSTTQSLGSASNTKILFDTEEFDTNNNFASSRFTPTVAGYYQISAKVRPNATNGEAEVTIYKNGSSYKSGSNVYVNAGLQNGTVISALVYMNGSTDYVEVYCYVTNSCTTSSSSASTYFQGVMVRSA